MKHSSLVGHLVELLDLVRAGRVPADAVVREFFRSRHYLGARDRRLIADRLYTIVRNIRLLEWYATAALSPGGGGPVSMPSLALSVVHDIILMKEETKPLVEDLDELWRSCVPALAFRTFVESARGLPPPSAVIRDPTARLALEYSLPEFVVAEWIGRFGETGAGDLCRASNQPAPVSVRVNTLKCTVEECRDVLRREGLNPRTADLAPHGLVLDRRINAQAIEAYRTGWFELQDEGSQLLSLLLEPAKGMHVVDACAGAGGKTLHIAALMGNSGEITAIDADARRLTNLDLRARRAGASIQRRLLDGRDDAVIDGIAGRADAVLVDAPCSGTGTLRRSPWLRLQLTQESVAARTERQGTLLRRYARLVRPGGRLVYATCSLLAGENERIVEQFLRDDPRFSTEDAGRLLRSIGLSIDSDPPFLNLRPDLGPTDGYFAAVLRRVAS